MRKIKLVLLGAFLLSFKVYSQNPNFHIYLCFGQSNMEGSASIEEQDKIGNDRFKVLAPMNCSETGRKKGNWSTAIPPLSQCSTGLSPADYFGRTMVEKLSDSIQLELLTLPSGRLILDYLTKISGKILLQPIRNNGLKIKLKHMVEIHINF